MPALDFIAPAAGNSTPDHFAPHPASAKPDQSAPPFDTVMGQALNGQPPVNPDSGNATGKDPQTSSDDSSPRPDAPKKKTGANTDAANGVSPDVLLALLPPPPVTPPVAKAPLPAKMGDAPAPLTGALPVAAGAQNSAGATPVSTAPTAKAGLAEAVTAGEKIIENAAASAEPAASDEKNPLAGDATKVVSRTTPKIPDATRLFGKSAPNNPPAPATGTSPAQQSSPVNMREQMQNLAGSAEQKVPGATALNAGDLLPHRNGFALAPATPPPLPEISSTAGGASPTHTASSGVETISVGAAVTVDSTGGALRAVERTQDLIATHALQMRETSLDSLHVVIKPDPTMQLSLELKLRGGTVEVNASMNQGDFNFLSRHWSDLQQQMEQRGIRLAPLATDNQSGGATFNFSQSQNQRPQSETPHESGATEFALANGGKSPGPAKKLVLRAAPGWESWA